jgi:outer membrane protein
MKTLLLLLVVCSAAAASAAEPGGRVLSLDEALRLARAAHPQARSAHAQTEASLAKIDETEAPLLPQISASGIYSRSRSTSGTSIPATSTATSTATGSTFGGGSGNSYNFGLNASQLLYDFGQTTGRRNVAKATARQQEENERNTAVQIALNVRSAYYAAVAARAMLKVASDNLANQEAHLRQIQGFVEVGRRPEIDLAQVRTDRANAQVQVINTEVGYASAKAVLNQAMGVEEPIGYDVVDPGAAAVDGENDSLEALMPTALGARPDLSALARQIESQQFLLGSIKGSYAPTLSAGAGLSESGQAMDDLRWNYRASLSLNWQIYGGGITDGQMREARANLTALRAQYDLQRQQVRLDVEQARLNVRATKAAVEAAREAAENARVRLKLAEGRYQAGVGSIIELGDAQVALTAAAAQEVQAVFNVAAARARLMAALGRE